MRKSSKFLINGCKNKNKQKHSKSTDNINTQKLETILRNRCKELAFVISLLLFIDMVMRTIPTFIL